MRPARAITCCLAAALTATGGAQAQDPTRVVITRAQIEAAGWFNLGEMLTGATGWQRSTLDAVWFFPSADGLPAGAAAPAEPDWTLLVDGQRVADGLLGARLLELLPLSPAEVESVTVTRVPRLAAGTVAARGVVEFHTRRPPRGPAASAAWHSGNVTGDPGPYGLTPIGGENVDRLGPYNYALASFGRSRWDVAAGARQGSSHITHRGIRERFDPVLYDRLGEDKWAPYDVVHARVGGTVFGGRHDVVAGRGWIDGPLFLPLAGGEQWLRARLEHLGGTGVIDIGATTIGYQLAHSDQYVGELPSPFPFVVGHSRRRTGGVVQLSVDDPRDPTGAVGRSARLGVGVARWGFERHGATAERTDATLFANLAARTGQLTQQVSAALARSSGGPVVGKGVLAARVAADSLTTLSLALSYVQHATGDDGTWVDRALLGLDTLRRDRDARMWADLGIARRVGTAWTADLGARAGAVTGVRLLALSGLPLAESASGGIAELRAGVSRFGTAAIPVARATYRYATPIGGDVQLRDALRATPAHTLEGSLVGAIGRDFRLGTFLYVASASRWPSLRGGPTTPVTLPAIERLDLSAEKWFWRRRVRAQLLVRNVLDRPERYHPLGADLPLRAHITVGVGLPAGG